MPKEAPRAPLCGEHALHYKKFYADKEHVYGFLRSTCNIGRILPQKDVGNKWHMPCSWLGDTSPDFPDPSDPDYVIAVRRRFGWKKLPYLLILPSPSSVDIHRKEALSRLTKIGRFLREQLEANGIDPKDVIVTYAARFELPRTLKQYSEVHKRACLPYLQEDINAIKPRVIIACGAPAVKALYGRKAKLDTYRGNILSYHGIPVIPTINPTAFLGSHANLSVFQSELKRAAQIRNRVEMDTIEKKDYRVCTTVEDVIKLCDDIRREKPKLIAFDTEFGNDVAREEYRYTLSIQLAWGPGKAAFIQLRDQKPQDPYWLVYFTGKGNKEGIRKPKCKLIEPGPLCGVPIHKEEELKSIWSHLQRLMLDRTWKIAAHHLRVDAEEFARAGFPIDVRIEDGVDTMLIHHLLYGDENQGLDHLARKYLPEVGAYWMELEEWLDEHERNKRLRYGYRDIPLDILIPYAQLDADVTLRIAHMLLEELDAVPTLKNLYWNQSAPTSLHLLDVERNGILIDEDRRMELHDAYAPVYDELLAKLRRSINWPSFNPGSSDDKCALLFSDTEYRKKKRAPAGAIVFKLKPVCNTDKYPRDWSEIEDAGEEVMNAPSTKAGIIELMAHRHPDIQQLKWLKHLSVIGTFLKNYLKPQTLNEYGVPKDGKGFHNNIGRDGRVRTRLSQLTETGRYTSSKANLQTKPKKQEAAAFEALVEHHFGISVSEYKKRIHPDYTGPDRISPDDALKVPKFASCFIAPPGYALIEADFATAELRVWAFMSGDKKLLDVVMHRDLHCEIASSSFGLYPAAFVQDLVDQLEKGDNKPYKDWCEEVKSKYGSLRVAAKSVNFGIMYGRSARALTTEINKVVSDPVTIDDTQRIINNFSTQFAVAWKWLNDNANRAIAQEYIENAFGRRRYFQGANELSDMDKAAIRREAKNSPIQGTVADLLAQAGKMLYRLIHRTPAGREMGLKVLLPIHDAFLFSVRYENVHKACCAIQLCMSTGNKIPGTDNYLDIDLEIMPHRWSDKGEKDPIKFMRSVGVAA